MQALLEGGEDKVPVPWSLHARGGRLCQTNTKDHLGWRWILQRNEIGWFERRWHLNWWLKGAEGPGRQNAGGKCLGGENTKDTGLGGSSWGIWGAEERGWGWPCGVRGSLEWYHLWQWKAFGGFEVGLPTEVCAFSVLPSSCVDNAL